MNQKTLSILIRANDQASKTLERVGDNVERSTNRIGSTLRKVGKVTAVTTAAMGAAFTGMIGKFVIGGGISRALNIEDAQAKLRGLGHDVQSVEGIMESALASVRGTAYGLDAAATTAAGAVAAGVKPGQDLTRYLSSAADAATIAGTSMSEMGSIFNKVQTQQRAYTMELNMLADRGIPIYQWLQEELGVTQEALRKMVADGEVDAETYFRAIQKNIGGAALESGQTTRGAWANMQAAMARVGARIAEDIMPKVREAIFSVTKWVDENADTIVDVSIKAIDGVLRFAKAVRDTVSRAMEIGRKSVGWLNDRMDDLSRFAGSARDTIIELKDRGIEAVNQVIEGSKQVWEDFTDWVNDNETAIRNVATTLGVIFGPALIKAGALATVQAAKIAASGIVAGAGWATGAATAAAAWTVNAVRMRALSTGIYLLMLKDSVASGLAWAKGAVIASAAWAVNMAKTSASMTATAVVSSVKAADAGWAWVINAARASFAWVTTELPKIVWGFVTTSSAAIVQATRSSAAWIASATRSAIAWVVTELPKIVAGFVTTSASAVVQAGVSSAAWAAAASKSAAAWVVTQLPRIIAAFVAMSASAVVNAAIASAAWVASAATSSASFTALSALVATPMVLPALVIGAALASIAAVWNAWVSTKAAIEQEKVAIQAEFDASVEMMNTARARRDRGEISEEQFRSIVGIAARHRGGSAMAGQPYLVGENSDGSLNSTSELFVPRVSGNIFSAKDLQAALGADGGQTFNMYGNVMLGDASAVDRYYERFMGMTDKKQALGEYGVGV